MAITVSTEFDGVNVKEFDVTATADADTSAVLTHGFGDVPFVRFTPRDGPLSAWIMTGVDENTITVEKATSVGSGSPSPTLQVIAVASDAKEYG